MLRLLPRAARCRATAPASFASCQRPVLVSSLRVFSGIPTPEPKVVHTSQSSINSNEISVLYHPANACTELQIGPASNPAAKLTHSLVPSGTPATLMLEYLFDMMAMMSLLPPFCKPKKILILGLGGGSLVHYFRKHQQQAQLDVVEYDQTIIEVARTYFQVPPDDDTLRIHHLDGKVRIQNLLAEGAGGSFDVIINDASHAPPSTLLTTETFQQVHSLLKPQGIYIQNLFTNASEQERLLLDILHSFPELYSSRSENNTNFLLCGVKDPHKPKAMPLLNAPKTMGKDGIWEHHPLSQDAMIEKAVWAYEDGLMALEVISNIPNIHYFSTAGATPASD